MIVIAGKITVKPELREEARHAALEMVEATRREAGCLSYAFYADLVDPGTFFIFEEWESDAALGAHFQSEHMARFQQQAATLVAGPPSITRYTVESASKMM